MKKLILLIPILFLTAETNNFTYDWVDKIIQTNAKKYGIEPALLYALRDHESRNGKDIERNDYYALIKQPWVVNILQGNQWPLKLYGHKLFWSVGDWQVCVIVAYEMGYRGTYNDLKRVDVNCKYACLFLRDKIAQYKYLIYVIAAYNGTTVNSEYTREVYRLYKKYGGKW